MSWGCIKIHPVRVGIRRSHTAYYALASVSSTVAEELAPRDRWAGLPRVVGPFGGARIGEGPREEAGGTASKGTWPAFFLPIGFRPSIGQSPLEAHLSGAVGQQGVEQEFGRFCTREPSPRRYSP